MVTARFKWTEDRTFISCVLFVSSNRNTNSNSKKLRSAQKTEWICQRMSYSSWFDVDIFHAKWENSTNAKCYWILLCVIFRYNHRAHVINNWLFIFNVHGLILSFVFICKQKKKPEHTFVSYANVRHRSWCSIAAISILYKWLLQFPFRMFVLFHFTFLILNRATTVR